LKVLDYPPCSQHLSLVDFHIFHPFMKAWRGHRLELDDEDRVVMVQCSDSTLGNYLPRGSWCVSVTSASVPRETIFNGLYFFFPRIVPELNLYELPS
jgi:hypothetical protein